MSALGASRPSGGLPARSLFGGKADIGQNVQNVAFDPSRHFPRIICCDAKSPDQTRTVGWKRPGFSVLLCWLYQTEFSRPTLDLLWKVLALTDHDEVFRPLTAGKVDISQN